MKHSSTSSGLGRGWKVSATRATTGRTLTKPFERNGGSSASTDTSVGRTPTSSSASRNAASRSDSPASFLPPGRHTSPACVLRVAVRVHKSTRTSLVMTPASSASSPRGPVTSGTNTEARRGARGSGVPRPEARSARQYRVRRSLTSSMPAVDASERESSASAAATAAARGGRQLGLLDAGTQGSFGTNPSARARPSSAPSPRRRRSSRPGVRPATVRSAARIGGFELNVLFRGWARALEIFWSALPSGCVFLLLVLYYTTCMYLLLLFVSHFILRLTSHPLAVAFADRFSPDRFPPRVASRHYPRVPSSVEGSRTVFRVDEIIPKNAGSHRFD